MRSRFPKGYAKRISKRDVANALTFYSGGTEMKRAPEPREPRQKPRRQAESSVNDVVKLWASTKGGELYRNSRGMMPLPNGGMRPYGVGPNGSGDLVGPMPVTITPEMVGRTVAIYCELESKTPIGRVQQHQLERISKLRDMGAMAGVVRSAEDANDVYRWWHTGAAR